MAEEQKLGQNPREMLEKQLALLSYLSMTTGQQLPELSHAMAEISQELRAWTSSEKERVC